MSTFKNKTIWKRKVLNELAFVEEIKSKVLKMRNNMNLKNYKREV